MNTKPLVVAAVGDLHTNSTVGLCPPRFQLDDGGEYVASKVQRWLWRNWRHYVARVQTVAEDNDAQIIAVFNGDIFDGDHHGTTQIITRNEADQMRLAYEVIAPLVEIAAQVYIIRGTPSHVGEAAAREEALANDLENAQHDETCASFWRLPLIAGGVFFDIAHMRRGGSLPWTAPNWANQMAARTMLEFHGERCPDVVLRSHRHKIVSSDPHSYPLRVFGMPCFQLATGYVHSRVAPGGLADIGGMIFVCQDGQYTHEMVRYQAKKRKPVRVTI